MIRWQQHMLAMLMPLLTLACCFRAASLCVRTTAFQACARGYAATL